MEQMRGFVELLRMGNAIAAGGLTFTGAFVAGGLESPVGLVIAVVATVLATGAGNAMNDYFDREVDAINRPDRPIPRGAVPAGWALWGSILLFVVAFGITLLLPLLAIAIAVVNLVVLVAYTELFKGLPGVGNALVAYLTGSTFLFGGAAVGGELTAVVSLFALAACATMAREIVKDVEDVAGDREEGLRTLPIVVGERGSLWLAAGFVAVAIVASPAPYLLDIFRVVYLVVLLPAVVLMGWAVRRSFRDPSSGQGWLKAAMFMAAGAFIVGRLAVVV